MNNELQHNTVPESDIDAKSRKGRKTIYTEEERKQRHKESVRKWKADHKENIKAYNKEYHKEFYQEHGEELKQNNSKNQTRGWNALKLLSEILEADDLKPYKEKAIDLIKNKKIIYA